jgi:hypothetical protein
MATQNERHVNEMVEASIAEMKQIQGGVSLAEYGLLLAVVGETTDSASLWGEGKTVRTDFCKTS